MLLRYRQLLIVLITVGRTMYTQMLLYYLKTLQ